MILQGFWGKITRVFAVFGSVADENASSASKQKLGSKPQVCVKKDAHGDIPSAVRVLLYENWLSSKLPRSPYPLPYPRRIYRPLKTSKTACFRLVVVRIFRMQSSLSPTGSQGVALLTEFSSKTRRTFKSVAGIRPS